MITVASIKGATGAKTKIIGLGIEACGDTYHHLVDYNSPEAKKSDVFIQTNMYKHKFSTPEKSNSYKFILDSQKPFLVNESANFRKWFKMYNRLGWYSYKWTEGIFLNKNSPPDRWNAFVKNTGCKIKPWKSIGDKIIIMEQKKGDSSLTSLYEKGYKNFTEWTQQIVNEIRKHTDRPIVIRPHPRNTRGAIKSQAVVGHNITVSENVTLGGQQGGTGLDEDLKQAYCVVTYNSLSAIEAVCEGIPVFAMDDGSMVWPIAHKKLSKIENINYDVDITQWCNDIAYTQWTPAEMQDGTAWQHLRQHIKT